MATQTEISNFIKRLGRLAVNECNNRITAGKGFVLPSVCIAQSAIETGWGTAGIMVKANAFFGIKAGGSWKGAVYRADTWEVDSGGAYNTTANFRAYGSLEESVTDYYDLIGNNSRYENGLSFGADKSKWLTPKQCITAIWSGGYATDTLYVEKIMNTITSRNLTAYDDLITGVGVGLLDTETTFKRADMVQGGITITDSGRSWANTESAVAVALDIAKAKTFTTPGTYYFNGLIGYQLYLYKLSGDVVTKHGPYNPPLNGIDGDPGTFTIDVIKGDKIAFDLTSANTDEFSVDELPADFAFTIGPPENTYPDSAELYSTPLAYFVKI